MYSSRKKGMCCRVAGVLFVLFAGIMSGCGSGGGGSTPPPPPSIQENSIVAGDFNGDGRLDLALASAVISGNLILPGQVELFIQNPFNPGFFSIQGVFEVGSDPFQVAAGDLDGDGLPDLVTANTSDDTVSVLLSNPFQPGNFFPAVDFACGPGPLSVAIGDIDGDGFPDIVTAVADGVDILFQDPLLPGTFFLPEFLPLEGGTFSVAIGDLDGDGIPDIAAAGLDAAFVFFQDPLAPPGTFFLPEGFLAGFQPNGVAIADIDRDGLDDIAVANVGSPVDGSGASFSVLIQDPLIAGNFLAALNFPTPNGAQNLAVGDLNGDGFPDIAVASAVLNAQSPGIISVFLQNPIVPVNFFLNDTFLDGFFPQSLAIGDLDVDGRPDIAIQDGPSVLFQVPGQPGEFFPEVLIGP